jgi:hypothetical protein
MSEHDLNLMAYGFLIGGVVVLALLYFDGHWRKPKRKEGESWYDAPNVSTHSSIEWRVYDMGGQGSLTWQYQMHIDNPTEEQKIALNNARSYPLTPLKEN